VLGEELQTRRGCLIKEEYFDNFYKDNCGIKILHGGAGREYGGGGRITLMGESRWHWILNTVA